jgi:hypothetical protein
MIAILANPLARLAIACAIAAGVGASCTAKHYTLKIDGIELRYQAETEKAKAEAAARVAANLKRNEEITHAYQRDLANLSSRYAAARVRIKTVTDPSVSKANPAASTDDSAKDDRLPIGMGTLELLEQCDLNTQKLLGLQGWLSVQ